MTWEEIVGRNVKLSAAMMRAASGMSLDEVGMTGPVN
jgi:hypothetical protein